MRILFTAFAVLCCGLLVGCTQAKATAQSDAAAFAGDTAGAAPDAADAATDAAVLAADASPDAKAGTQCSATCGNGTCEGGEAPGACKDCPGYGSACIESECAAELATCNAKPSCSNMLACLHQCGDTPTCAESCKHTGVAGVSSAFGPLVACIAAKGCTTCGNGTCDAAESSGNCPQDCKPSAGNGLCESGESPLSCTADCGTFDPFACTAAQCPEVLASCKADPVCGPAFACYSACSTMGCIDACAAKWGSATMQQISCKSHVCKGAIQPEEVCGNGLCGMSEVYSCPADCAATPTCGNGACEAGESSKTCAGDCGAATDMFSCIAKNCATFDAACQGDAACMSIVSCMKACPLTAEWKTCANSCSPIGKAAWLANPLFRCGDQHGCKPVLPPYCGDGTCQATETEADCQSDCYEPPPVCGDGWCAKSETVASCAQDCATCETTGCKPDKGGEAMVCCKVNGQSICAYENACD